MTLEEANQKAKELFGPNVYCKVHDNGLFDILVDSVPLPTLLGWGHSWEDALEMARVRSEWHGHLLNVKRWRQLDLIP